MSNPGLNHQNGPEPALEHVECPAGNRFHAPARELEIPCQRCTNELIHALNRNHGSSPDRAHR